MGAKCCLLCHPPYAGYHPYPADVTKLGNPQRNQYGSPNPTYNNKFSTQQYGQSYQPLQQNQAYQPPQQPSHMLPNQAYQRNTNHYAATTQIQYQGYNKGSLNDINQSPYHHPAPPQPPNYQETINNLYHRQHPDHQLSKYANPAKLQQQQNPYSNYNAYSTDTSPVHQPYAGGKQSDYAAYASQNGLSNYHNYDIDYHLDEYSGKPQGDEYGGSATYGRTTRGALDPLGSKGNLEYSDTDLELVKQHQQQYLKEGEELKAEERRRKLISDVVRDGAENGLAGVSAGELLNKTHEELVLLLIQLRRQHSALQEARKQARAERDSQARLAHLDSENREQHLDQLAVLNRHLLDLDKQYEMGKPLINLVDNMVKLGTLYRGLETSDSPSSPSGQQNVNSEGLEFTRREQERRIVDEDRQEFELLTPDQADLEGKVLRLYNLEHSLQRESLTIQALQTDKEALQRALFALSCSETEGPQGPEDIERRQRQRQHLERELSKLRAHLAVSAGKLEETAAENSRLEHEMMMLRQKIQQTMARNARRDCGDGTSKTRHIESEMIRVQALLEDLQNRRMHLSQQIQRLTMSSVADDPRGYVGQGPPSPSSYYGSGLGSNSTRRRTHTTWLETDLDRMITRDRGLDLPDSPLMDPSSPDLYRRELEYGLENPYMISGDFSRGGEYTPPEARSGLSPEYAAAFGIRRHTLDPSYVQRLASSSSAYDNRPLFATSFKDDLAEQRAAVGAAYGGGCDRNSAANKPDGEEQARIALQTDDSDDADERMKRFYGLLPKEKPLEPKTVRIVKRESTERRKDRTYSSSKKVGDSSLSHVLEDDLESDSGEPTSEPELDSESSPAHIPLASSLSAVTALKGHQHLSSSYSSGYSSSSQTYLQPQQQPSYPPSSVSIYQATSDYPSSSVASVPNTSASSTGPSLNGSGLPSYSARTASLPRNYGRGNEWGDKPNRRGGPGTATAALNASGPSKYSTSASSSAAAAAAAAASTARPSNLPLKQKSGWKSKATSPRSHLSAREQLFGGSSPPSSPAKSEPPSPVFKSAAAQEIIKEMTSEAEKYRRAVPKEKRRHVTISSSTPMSMEASRLSTEEGARSRDDCDMARALRPHNHPDVVKSTLSTRDLRINETTIDSLFGAPSKIHIPERYVPDEDDTKEMSPEERRRREHKAESIRRMLTESNTNLTAEGAQGEEPPASWVKEGAAENGPDGGVSKAKERKEREHLLAMNQILARQVMEKSRLVAATTSPAASESHPHLQF